MQSNPIIDAMLRRKSIRKYTKEMPSDEVIRAIVRAGMQAPFASQSYSVLLSRRKKGIAWGAPLEFVICIDSYKLERIMEKRGWKMISNDLMILLFGLQDATLMAENMVMAAESLGLGSCFIGATPYYADKVAEKFGLPPRVFPLVGLVMGYPAEDPPPRPRYPLDFVLFEDKYPEFDDATLEAAMRVMDDGYMAQGYYRDSNLMIKLEKGRKETFDFETYSWTEHISRKWGQWNKSIKPLLKQFVQRGFHLDSSKPEDS